MKSISFLFVILFTPLSGEKYEIQIDTTQSYVSYTGKHFLHQWAGTSKTINGHFIFNSLDPTSSAISIKIPIITFDSKNSNRDSNMFYVVDEFQYPYVLFESSGIHNTQNKDEFLIIGSLYFHGVHRDIEVVARVNVIDKEIIGQSSFKINLDDFDIERPTLLLIPIEESITINVFLVGEFDQAIYRSQL